MIPIGERRKPRPQGRPGYLRIDTVHQGDRDGQKGIYHINAVDEVTHPGCRNGRPVSSPLSEPLLNFHRPCAIPEIVVAPNGKRRRLYRRWATPLEIFRQTPKCESYLRPGVNMDDLERLAQAQTDTEAAIGMQQAKRKLLAGIAKRSA